MDTQECGELLIDMAGFPGRGGAVWGQVESRYHGKSSLAGGVIALASFSAGDRFQAAAGLTVCW